MIQLIYKLCGLTPEQMSGMPNGGAVANDAVRPEPASSPAEDDVDDDDLDLEIPDLDDSAEVAGL